MRLIDADAYLKKVCTYNETGCGSCKLQTKCPVDEPTVDVVSIRHGRWVWNDYSSIGNYHCTACGKICICNGDYDYCPNCGARMVKDETD